MGGIDWDKLHRATSTSNQPTPGYLFNDIIQDVSHAPPKEIPAVAEYLADCVDGEHAHVKLKALFVIKTLAYRIPPFCACMQERLASVEEAANFSGPPSALFGDEPYRLVREAAEGALAALTAGEYYHQQYREMSQRIVGFGNYLPDEDTVLPDGSINIMRDVTYRDVTARTVGLITGGVGALFGAVKEIVVSPFVDKTVEQGDDLNIDCVDGPDDIDLPPSPCAPDGAGAVGGTGAGSASCGRDGDDIDCIGGAPVRFGPAGGELEDSDDDDDDGTGGGLDEHGCYHPSPGKYVPPMLPAFPLTGARDSGACGSGALRSEASDAAWPKGGSGGDDADDQVYQPWRDGDSLPSHPSRPSAAAEAFWADEEAGEPSLLAMLERSAAQAPSPASAAALQSPPGQDLVASDAPLEDSVYQPWRIGDADTVAAIGGTPWELSAPASTAERPTDLAVDASDVQKAALLEVLGLGGAAEGGADRAGQESIVEEQSDTAASASQPQPGAHAPAIV